MIKYLTLLLILCLYCDITPNQPPWQSKDEIREDTLPGMATEVEKLKTLDDVKKLLSEFQGGCWEYAVLGEWALEAIGIDSRILILYRGEIKHAVVLSSDNRIFITNGNLATIVSTKTWRKAVLTYFNPPYERIEELRL